MHKLRIAVVSSKSKYCDIKGNLNHFKSLIKRASARKAKLVCFPELALSCYTTEKNILSVAQKIPGPITDELVMLAREYGVYLSMGSPERSGSRYYISQIIVGPQGYMGKYRKHFPTELEQACGFSPGMTFPTFIIDGFRMGVNICYDGRHSKTIEAMKKANVNFIHHATGNYMLVGENADEWTRGKIVYSVSRAIQARAYILINCSAGDTVEENEKKSHSSGSLVIDPLGQVLRRTTQATRTEKILVTEITRPLSSLIPKFEMKRLGVKDR